MQFQWNYYAIVKEKSSGSGAFELLADPRTGTVFPEMEPNMMWNTRYSPMATYGGEMTGGMGGFASGGMMSGTWVFGPENANVNPLTLGLPITVGWFVIGLVVYAWLRAKRPNELNVMANEMATVELVGEEADPRSRATAARDLQLSTRTPFRLTRPVPGLHRPDRESDACQRRAKQRHCSPSCRRCW